MIATQEKMYPPSPVYTHPLFQFVMPHDKQKYEIARIFIV